MKVSQQENRGVQQQRTRYLAAWCEKGKKEISKKDCIRENSDWEQLSLSLFLCSLSLLPLVGVKSLSSIVWDNILIDRRGCLFNINKNDERWSLLLFLVRYDVAVWLLATWIVWYWFCSCSCFDSIEVSKRSCNAAVKAKQKDAFPKRNTVFWIFRETSCLLRLLFG